jgi:hypothetical protein
VTDETPPRTVEVPIGSEVLPPHGRRTWVLFGVMGVAVLAVVWVVLSQRILAQPVRGDVDVDSVVAVRDDTGWWAITAVWSRPAPAGCVVLGWKVATSDRGWEVASQQMAPPDAVFPAICASPTASIVLEHSRTDPSGSTVAVNGESFTVTAATAVDGYTTGGTGG